MEIVTWKHPAVKGFVHVAFVGLGMLAIILSGARFPFSFFSSDAGTVHADHSRSSCTGKNCGTSSGGGNLRNGEGGGGRGCGGGRDGGPSSCGPNG